MDDFLVYGATFDLYLDNVTKVLHRCEKVNLILNWKKCYFMAQEGVVLGHVVSQRGIQIDRANIEVIECLPSPTCVKRLQIFHRHAGFHQHFIKDFSKPIKPLTLLLAKDNSFIFPDESFDAFYRIKKTLITTAISPIEVFLSRLCVMLVIMWLGWFRAMKR